MPSCVSNGIAYLVVLISAPFLACASCCNPPNNEPVPRSTRFVQQYDAFSARTRVVEVEESDSDVDND